MNNLTKSKQPSVSVNILCYNHEKYIAQAIESALSQTYLPSEIVVGDNMSTDGSREIIRHYADRYKIVKPVFFDSNTFVSFATNQLIFKSTGDYIALTAGDDFFEPTKIEEQLDFMLSSDLDVSFTWVSCVNELSHQVENSIEKWMNRDMTSAQDIMELLVRVGNFLPASSIMCKRDVFANFGKYDLRLLQTQDWDYQLRLLLDGCSMGIYPKKLFNYRILDNGGNLSMIPSRSRIVRSNFENYKISKLHSEFDTKTISKAIGVECDNINKYKNLINFYLETGNYSFANGVLESMYAKLGDNFGPSELYKDFLEIYSNFDIFNTYDLRGCFVKLFVRSSESDFVTNKTLAKPIRFDGADYQFEFTTDFDIFEIKIELANKPIEVKFEKLYLLKDDKTEEEILLVGHNANSQTNLREFVFYHANSSLIFRPSVPLARGKYTICAKIDVTSKPLVMQTSEIKYVE